MKKIDKTKDFLNENLPYQIDFTANFNKAFKRKFHATYMDAQTTADEFAILGMLNDAPGISQIKMGKCLFKGKAHVGKMLSDMESRGLLEREIKEDGSSAINRVTPKGRKIFENGIKTIKKNIHSKMKVEFSEDEIKQFMSYLKRYRAVLSSIVDVSLK